MRCRAYVDGSAMPTRKGVMGAAFIYVEGNDVKYARSWKAGIGTAYQSEIHALIGALKFLSEEKISHCLLLTDSKNVMSHFKGLQDGSYQRNQYKTRNGRILSHLELWSEAIPYLNPNYNMQWVRGHNGNVWNEYADRLAKNAVLGKSMDEANPNLERVQPLSHKHDRSNVTLVIRRSYIVVENAEGYVLKNKKRKRGGSAVIGKGYEFYSTNEVIYFRIPVDKWAQLSKRESFENESDEWTVRFSNGDRL